MIAKRAVLQEGLEPSGDYTIGAIFDCYNRSAMGVYESVREYTRRYGLIPEGAGVVAAVSGGADSRCMLDCMDRMGHALTVAHFDHGLRPESAGEAEFVRGTARDYGYPFATEQWQGGDAASGIEEAARWARYRFLVRVAIETGASRIATGHTLSDQAETILLHLVRGAGLEGLSGMEPVTELEQWRQLDKPQDLYLVRPLLEISHSDAVAYCRSRDLTWLEDPSNLDPKYSRNLIRLRLMPLLEQINPQAQEALARAGQSLKPVRDLLARAGREAWGEVVAGTDYDRVVFIREAFSERPLAVRVWLVRKAAETLSPGVEISFQTSLELAKGVSQDGYQPAQLPLGLEVVQDAAGPALALSGSNSYLTGFPQLVQDSPRTLAVPGEIALRSGWRLESRAVNPGDLRDGGFPEEGNKWLVVLELAPEVELRVRSFRSGDRIQPLGMEGHIKVGDLFTNEKVPVGARTSWPLITTSSDELVWVPGLRLAHPFRVKAESQRLVSLEVLPPE